MYVIILAVDGRWLWKCSHFISKALHRNRKWRPLPGWVTWWAAAAAAALAACCGCLGPISGHHVHAGWPQWPTEGELGRHTTPCWRPVDAVPTYAPITDVNQMSNRHRGWP